MGTMLKNLTLAASSTPMVVRFRCSTPSEPTMASACASKPHIFRHLSTLMTNGGLAWECRCGSCRHTRLLSRPTGRTRAVEVSPRTKGPHEPSTLQCAYPSVEHMPSGPGSPRGADVRSVNNHHARHRPRCAERVCSITPSARKSPRSVPRLSTP